MNTTQLLGLSMEPIIRAIKRMWLQAKRSWLYSDMDYFREQQKSGNAGLARTHKQLAMVESELRALK